MKEPTHKTIQRFQIKNKILSPNEKLKEMQAFINSLQSKKEVPTQTTKTKGK